MSSSDSEPEPDSDMASLPVVPAPDPTLLCAVCTEPFGSSDADTAARVLPCGHVFHSSCILPWLRRRNSCPLCRRSPLPHRPPRADPAQPTEEILRRITVLARAARSLAAAAAREADALAAAADS